MTIEIDSRGGREGGVDCRVREGKALGVSKLFNHKSDFWRNSAIGFRCFNGNSIIGTILNGLR